MAGSPTASLATVGAGDLLALACRAETVYLKFLHNHGVPCQAIIKRDSTVHMDEVVTCEDGREWVLFWLENEVAFVKPETGDLYRWQRDMHRSAPSL